MFFLSLFMDLMMLLNISAGAAGVDRSDFAQVADHTIHGHLPGPVADHFTGLADHFHHGQHGHSAGPSGHEVFH